MRVLTTFFFGPPFGGELKFALGTQINLGHWAGLPQSEGRLGVGMAGRGEDQFSQLT